MFYIIIGQSGSGKTTFAKTNFLSEPIEIIEDIIPYSKCSNGIIALGRYGIGKRTEGTDTLSYSAKNNIKKLLRKLKHENVLLEGDRINNKEIFDFIASLGVGVKLYLVTCSLNTSMRRLRAAGSTITPSFVKMTKTKSKRMFLEYGQRFNGEIINTEEQDNANSHNET
ncbi:MAG: hypothetical protein IJX94_01285 [Clostridia bacterium]|nr:hypothetical protein [Clostridia bacterium]